MSEVLLEVTNVTVKAGERTLLSDITFQARAGERLALLGPNGAGKSTLMRALAGDLTPDAGAVTLRGRPLPDWPLAKLARRRSVMLQHTPVGFPVRVDEVVALGLPGRRHGNAGDALVGQLLDRFGVAHLRGRAYPSLSGGEQQRVHLARVLAQVWDTPGPRLLLLDESTSALDPAQQYRVLETLSGLAEQGGFLIVLVCHDLALAGAFASRVLMLDQGRLLADDLPARVLTPERLARVYGLRSRWLEHPDGPVLHVEGALPRSGVEGQSRSSMP
ncbi:heme ABC transporter ATP-binding protein [Alloalcanivorax sp. C16-1]|uniref:heme ABC transporter ATP-binding protein n=1 Tax=Alloalcanivorax sp. C16-1 TaxID=3390051 RepID=UPI00397053A0